MTTGKRKLDSGWQMFDEKIGRTIIFAEANNGSASCLICNKSVSNEYNFRRHYDTKHELKFAVSSIFLCYKDFLVKIVFSSLLIRCLLNFYIFLNREAYKFKREFGSEIFLLDFLLRKT